MTPPHILVPAHPSPPPPCTKSQTFYGLAPDLHVTDQLITRSLESSRPKRLYFVSRATLDLVVADEQEALKITSLGLKVRPYGPVHHVVLSGVLRVCMSGVCAEACKGMQQTRMSSAQTCSF